MIDIWNGITVLDRSVRGARTDESVLVTALNYAHQPLPVQMRVRGTLFGWCTTSLPRKASPCCRTATRDGHTEFLLPALRIGGRVFLSPEAALR